MNSELYLNNIENWKYFLVKDIFDYFESPKGKSTEYLVEGSEIPYIGATNKINGLLGMCSNKKK